MVTKAMVTITKRFNKVNEQHRYCYSKEKKEFRMITQGKMND